MLLLPVVVYKTQSVAWSPLCAQEWSSSSVPPIYLHEFCVCMYKAGAHAPFPYLLFETLSRRRTQQHAMCPNIFRTSNEGSGGGGMAVLAAMTTTITVALVQFRLLRIFIDRAHPPPLFCAKIA